MVTSFQDYYLLNRGIFEIFEIAFKISIILCFILRGLAYKKLQDNYFGFVPYVGDIICMWKIATKYESRRKATYVAFSIILLPIQNFLIKFIITFKIYLAIFLSSGLWEITIESLKKEDPGFYRIFLDFSKIFMFLLFVFLLVFVIVVFFNFFFRYKILRPLVEEITYSEAVGFRTLIFAIFPFIFYIWLLCNNSLDEWDEF